MGAENAQHYMAPRIFRTAYGPSLTHSLPRLVLPLLPPSLDSTLPSGLWIGMELCYCMFVLYQKLGVETCPKFDPAMLCNHPEIGTK